MGDVDVSFEHLIVFVEMVGEVDVAMDVHGGFGSEGAIIKAVSYLERGYLS